MVRPARFELTTFGSGGQRSIRLSYGRTRFVLICRLVPAVKGAPGVRRCFRGVRELLRNAGIASGHGLPHGGLCLRQTTVLRGVSCFRGYDVRRCFSAYDVLQGSAGIASRRATLLRGVQYCFRACGRCFPTTLLQHGHCSATCGATSRCLH